MKVRNKVTSTAAATEVSAMAFGFASEPTGLDYLCLADHLDSAEWAGLHPALGKQRAAAAETLRRIAAEPDRDVHRRVYHTLRLFVP